MKLLILDIDETLIHTEKFPANYLGEGEFDFKYQSSNKDYEYFTIKRPFIDEFLWTAASKDYAENVLRNIGIDKSLLEFFYTEENCTIKLDYETCNYYGEKNLNKIRKKGYNLEQTLIVDDIAKTAIHNYGNLIQIKPFMTNRSDTELLKLISYLEKIKNAERFRSIEKRGWSSN